MTSRQLHVVRVAVLAVGWTLLNHTNCLLATAARRQVSLLFYVLSFIPFQFTYFVRPSGSVWEETDQRIQSLSLSLL